MKRGDFKESHRDYFLELDKDKAANSRNSSDGALLYLRASSCVMPESEGVGFLFGDSLWQADCFIGGSSGREPGAPCGGENESPMRKQLNARETLQTATLEDPI
jgi:hypothetical protein